jgi:tetratricopeptide (TPR) repeat protein
MASRYLLVMLLAATLITLQAQRAPVQAGQSPHVTYSALVDRYLGAGRDEAVSELMRWDAQRVRTETRQLFLSASERRLEAAALLHTDALLRDSPLEVHLDVATAAVATLKKLAGRDADNDVRRFCVRWTALTAGYLLFYGHDPKMAEGLLAGSWADPEILLARGSILEARFYDPPASFRPEAGEVDAPSRVLLPPPRERPLVLLARAEGEYRAALRADPECVEARLRLGRVLFLEAKHERALQELQQARREADDSHLRYLALLFLGALYEQADDREAAEAAYQAATAEHPTAQTSRLALAHLLDAAGRTEEARAEVRRIFGEPGKALRMPDRDPWWLYKAAQFWQTERRMAELRAIAQGQQ